jgi:AcrR family transcriptional regulator
MAPRADVSPVRAARSEAKRQQLLLAAADLLAREPVGQFSLESVARAAGVTRLTVYNQFGSRRGLLEAVFDHLAREGELTRIPEAMADPDPRRGLDRLVEIFCGFWSANAAAGRLNEAIAADPELALAVRERNERRRGAVQALVDRIAPNAPPQRRQEAIDLIFALMSYPMWRGLADAPSGPNACEILQRACRAAVEGLG